MAKYCLVGRPRVNTFTNFSAFRLVYIEGYFLGQESCKKEDVQEEVEEEVTTASAMAKYFLVGTYSFLYAVRLLAAPH